MELREAVTMYHVGAITGATVREKPSHDGSSWIVEFQTNKPLPPMMSYLLEAARGGPKIFKGIQAALNDIKSIGLVSATVSLAAAASFRTNRFEWLYEWIRGLRQQNYNEEQILGAFATYAGTRLDLNDDAAVKLARIIIRHALGLSDGKELEAYLPPFEVLDASYLKRTPDGYLCQATCPDSRDDFTFLIDIELPEKELKAVFAERKPALCRLALVAAHQRYPQGYDDPDISKPTTGTYTPPVARFRLTHSDLECLIAA